MIINGTLTPPPPVSSNVTWTMKDSTTGEVVSTASSLVNSTTGTYRYTLCADVAWPVGGYTLVGEWASAGFSANATTTFNYGAPIAAAAALNGASAACAPLVPKTNDWKLLDTPNYVSTAGQCCGYNITFRNDLNESVTGTVNLVLRNGLDQTVYMTTMTVHIGPAFYASQYGWVSGMPAGTYYATIFAVSSSGCAIASSKSFVLTVPARG